MSLTNDTEGGGIVRAESLPVAQAAAAAIADDQPEQPSWPILASEPEMRARITAARAAVRQWQREAAEYTAGTGPKPHYDDHAYILGAMLSVILDVLGDKR